MPEIEIKALDTLEPHSTTIDCDQDGWMIEEEIDEWLRSIATPCSWCGNNQDGIHIGHDYEGDTPTNWQLQCAGGFGDLHVLLFEAHALPDLERVGEVAQAIEEHGEIFATWAAAEDPNATSNNFEQALQMKVKTIAEFGEYWAKGMYEVPEWLDNYIDWEAFGHDILADDFYTIDHSDGYLYIFRNDW